MGRLGMRRVAALVLLATASGIGCTSEGTATDPTSPTPEAPATVPPDPSLSALEIAAPEPGLPEYRRDAFGEEWAYDSTSGCNTRERVLIAESLEEPTMGERCKPLAGVWRSRYDGLEVTDPALLQIDHFIPLANAWRSGAADWSDERRFRFANDLNDPATLVAVTGSTNQSKGDSTPDQWLPPDATDHCAYAQDWVRVKATWGLTVTQPEHDALARILAAC